MICVFSSEAVINNNTYDLIDGLILTCGGQKSLNY